jgi:hypothetical protein
MAEAQIFRGVDRLKLIAMIVGSKVTNCSCVDSGSIYFCAGATVCFVYRVLIQHSKRPAYPDRCCLCTSVVVLLRCSFVA